MLVKQENPFKDIMESKVGTTTRLNGKDYLYFAGTGYFQLQSNPDMIQAAVDATLQFGIGSATSRTISGTTPLLLQLEEKIADFFRTEDAAYLPSGYLSNMAGFQALEKSNVFDIIFIDELSHYSNIGGAMMTDKQVVEFKHRDPDNLRDKIKTHLKKDKSPLIVSDGLFPIWAELAPVDDYLKIAEEFNGTVWVDDSHSVGILGENGRGVFEYYHLNSERLYMGGTLSKAFGAYGGFVPGRSSFIHNVKTGHVMTGSNAPPNAMVAAAIKGLEIVKGHPEIRQKLWENSIYLKNGIKKLGIIVTDNYLPIVTFKLADTNKMKHIQRTLMEKGIYIQFVKYVGSGADGVLRIVVTSSHTKPQIDYLISSISMLI